MSRKIIKASQYIIYKYVFVMTSYILKGFEGSTGGSKGRSVGSKCGGLSKEEYWAEEVIKLVKIC